MKSDLFFFISSVGFIILFIILVVLLIYLTIAVKSFNILVKKLDSEMGSLGDTAQSLVNDIQESFFYKLLFSNRKKRILSTKFKQK